MSCTRTKLVAQAQKWAGLREDNGTFKVIIDTYNSHKPLARGYELKYTDEWCSGFASACAIACGATDIIPTEVGCGKHIDLFKKMNIWIENDAYVPAPGDYIFYYWKDNGNGDCVSGASHVGIVEKVENGYITVIEGNYAGGVNRRSIKLNAKYIRGFGVPKYDTDEMDKPIEDVTEDPVVTLKFKIGDIVMFGGNKHYTSANSSSGSAVKASKAKITSVYKTGKHPYHCRAVNDAGAFISGVYGWVDAADLSAIKVEYPEGKPVTPVAPVAIKKGDIVSIAKNATYYSGKDVPDWVVAKNWIVYATPVGDRVIINKSADGKDAINSPIHAKFLTVVKADEPWTPKVGDIVNYNGTKHYANANAANGAACKGGQAKITNIYQLGKSKHPYHLVRVSGKGATVYGWVDEGTFTKA